MNTTPISPDAALDKMFELAVRLTEAMQRGLGERGLTASRAEVLLVLAQSGAMVQRQIGDSLRCTPRYVTALIDTLEAEGLVRRAPHPTDRRATLVSLTKRGAAATARMAAERQQAAGWLLGDVAPDDLATFVAIANQVLDRIGAVPPTESSSALEPSASSPEAGPSQSPGRTRRSRPSRTRGQSTPNTRQEDR